MNAKNNADLERKLTAPGFNAPKPPAGLAEKIKRDIPPHFVMMESSERDRFTRSIFFDIRVVASILLVVTSAYFMLTFLNHADRINVASNAPHPMPARQLVQPATLTTSNTAAAGAPMQATRVEPMMPVTAPKTEPARRDEPVGRIAELSSPREESGDVAFAPLPPPPAPVAESITVTASAPLIAENRAVASSVMAPAAAPPPAAPSASRSADTFKMRSGIVAEAKADDLAMSRPAEVFGISVDRQAFARIKTAIEHGQQPDASSIDVAALINYFAGDGSKSTRDVRLEAEGSPAPVADSGNGARRMIRVTVDTATAEVPAGSSIPPVATNASLDVNFDGTAVVAHHVVGGDGMLPSITETTLLKNTSVTVLYDVELTPRGAPWQRIASFSVTFRSVTDGRERTVERTLHRRDLAPTWFASTRRHRLAALGAVWGETLKGNAGANDVARRATELARQAPEDVRAKELADVANASSQLHGGAAGSGW